MSVRRGAPAPSSAGSPSNGRGAINAQAVLSFYFKIEGLAPDYNVQPNRAQHHPLGFWAPPDNQNAYISTTPFYFLWYGGTVTLVQNLPSILQRYGEATIFSQKNDSDHLLAVDFNARSRNVSHAPGGGWKRLSFDHVQLTNGSTYSKINLFGCERHLAAPGSPHWVPQLLPREYDYQRTGPNDHPIQSDTTSAGLIGSLPILLSLAAFSAPRDCLPAVLTQCIAPGAWRPHPMPTGRTSERGMIVAVYLDPNNPTYSNPSQLDMLRDGYSGPFYGP